ncbi:putative integral membrane efflux protein [Microbacterium esteraromaticum]|uniref:Putative integral membrane efflux protein n=1 Tax=Microbacterium esteraromaticum TaxID=57043 RepID=A0A1R4JUT2_9MICO|nr:putative integral membrane efflux protein [Microbacterium esteraromaticum]
MTRSFRSLQIVPYRQWSLAQLLSGSGGAASIVALAWLVVDLGGDGLALGVVTSAMMLPTLLLGSFAGTFVDRFSRRSVLLVTATTQMAVATTLAAVTLAGAETLVLLFALSLAHGLAFSVDNPARQLFVLDLVGRARITSAVSMNEVIINGSRVLGPAVAGALLVVAGPGWCFAFNALMFIPSMVVLTRLRYLPNVQEPASAVSSPFHTPGAGAGADAHRAPATELLSPWQFVVRTGAVRSTLLLAVGAAASFNIAVVIPLVVADVFHADGGTYGALAVAFGLGALPGAVFSATGPLVPRAGEVRALAVGLAIAVIAAAAAPTLPLLFAGMALVGGASMWFIARANAFVMLTTPNGIRGRVMGIWAMALPGSSVITGLLTGILADATDPRFAYGIVGVCTAFVVSISWRTLRSR